MKKAIILFVIFAVIVAAGVAEHYFIHATFDEFEKRVDEIEMEIDGDNTAAALDKTKDLQDWWHVKKQTIEMISYSPDARQVNVVIGELQGSLEIDDLENASSKIVSLRQLTDNIREMLDFNARDII